MRQADACCATRRYTDLSSIIHLAFQADGTDFAATLAAENVRLKAELEEARAQLEVRKKESSSSSSVTAGASLSTAAGTLCFCFKKARCFSCQLPL